MNITPPPTLRCFGSSFSQLSLVTLESSEEELLQMRRWVSPTCEHGRMGAVQDDEFGHHLWVVNGKEPRYGPAPVVSDHTASVVP